jgi:hypothetical protein
MSGNPMLDRLAAKPELAELYRRYGHPVEYRGRRANVGCGYGDMLELNGDEFDTTVFYLSQ